MRPSGSRRSVGTRRSHSGCAAIARLISASATCGASSIAAMFVHRERVRFRDLDAMGHVNNAVFLTYIE